MGCGPALIFRAATALITDQIDERYLGAGFGMAGTLNNLSWAACPILGGALVGMLGYVLMFPGMGAMLIGAGVEVSMFGY